MLNKTNYELLFQYKSPCRSPGEPCSAERFANFVENGFVVPDEYKPVAFSSPYISPSFAPETWRITAKGLDALSEFEEISKKQAQQERDKRFEKKISILNLFVPFITFILGILAEHYVSIIGFIISFFQRFTS